MELKKASHCVYQIRYHMVFCIKYRRGLLAMEERSDYLRQIFHEIGQRYWFEMEEMGTDGDHVHLFVGAAPKYAPSRVSREAQSFIRWVSGSVPLAGVGFHTSTQPTFILYLIPPTYLLLIPCIFSGALLQEHGI
jgi:putative transposase